MGFLPSTTHLHTRLGKKDQPQSAWPMVHTCSSCNFSLHLICSLWEINPPKMTVQANSPFRSSTWIFAALFLQHMKGNYHHLNMLMAPFPSLNAGKPTCLPGNEDPSSSLSGSSTSAYEKSIWSTVSSSGLPSSRKMRSYWRVSSRGL